MTDNQIIIDGVDVSLCKKYKHEIIRCNATLKNMCFCGGRCTDKKNANCYYKQLKRKEQECEELKKERDTLSFTRNKLLGYLWETEENLKDYIEHFNKASDELDQLKAENEKYSLFIEKLCDYIGLECDSEEQSMRTLSDFARQMNKAR